MRLVERDVPLEACTVAPGRPRVAICLHHTAGPSLPFPQRGASWHRCFDQDGTVYLDVSPEQAAHGAGNTDRWRPPWVVRTPAALQPLSDINYCVDHWEIVYAPQEPWGQAPTDAQYAALREAIAERYATEGAVPLIGHGQVDRDKWPTEPHGLDWTRLGCGPLEIDGYWWLNGAAGTSGDAMTSDNDRALLELAHALDEANGIKQAFEALLRDLESRRRLKRGTVDRLIAEARGY